MDGALHSTFHFSNDKVCDRCDMNSLLDFTIICNITFAVFRCSHLEINVCYYSALPLCTRDLNQHEAVMKKRRSLTRNLFSITVGLALKKSLFKSESKSVYDTMRPFLC